LRLSHGLSQGRLTPLSGNEFRSKSTTVLKVLQLIESNLTIRVSACELESDELIFETELPADWKFVPNRTPHSTPKASANLVPSQDKQDEEP
jgi:hypothetical protein